MSRPDRPWWRDAVFYEIYVRSFADASGDGIGDLEGIRQKLPYLRDLGVEALWLTPFYRSPMADHGYDVEDARDVDPLFGSLADFDRMLADAHELGIRVTVDVVPNHASDQHPWFRAALAAPAGSPERDRFIFADGDEPPNNWPSIFGGHAWDRTPDGQWYLHLFAPEQPDLNWRNPEVVEDYERTLRFWLDRGVDGFRVDVAMGLFKAGNLPDLDADYVRHPVGHGPEDGVIFNQPEVHDVYRQWRRVLDEFDGDRMMVGEVTLRDPEEVAHYVRPDEMHLAFNFRLIHAPWSYEALRDAVDSAMAATASVGAPATWMLSCHDVTRHVTRYGGGEPGVRRARAAALLMLGLPGPAYLYQGDELGLEQVDVAPEARQDPIWKRSGRTEAGRDGCRVPLPWSGTEPPFGFCPDGARPWLPQPASWAGRTAEAQRADPTSPLALYIAVIAARRAFISGTDFAWQDAPAGVLAWRRGDVDCLVNLSAHVVPLPPGELLVGSDATVCGSLPPDCAAWVRTIS